MNLRSEFDNEDIPEDYLIERMRTARNDLLAQSDWTQLADSPLTGSKKTEWETYRQALRDFPAGWTPADTAEFPKEPT